MYIYEDVGCVCIYTQLHRPQEGPHSSLTEPLYSAGYHPCGGQQWSPGAVCPSRPTDSSQGGGQWVAPAVSHQTGHPVAPGPLRGLGLSSDRVHERERAAAVSAFCDAAG